VPAFITWIDSRTAGGRGVADEADLMIGEWAIAIGSPFGSYLADTQPTVTVGVISANHRDIKQDENSGHNHVRFSGSWLGDVPAKYICPIPG